MVFVSPFALQLTAAAELTVTEDGPVMMKSDPLAAIELHNIGSPNVNVIDCGVQGGAGIVPIGTGGWAARTNCVLLPAVACRLH